ncbi:MAG TPA: AlkA N-terminal domain-containing protein [Gemmatimonadaceae bacterium]|nr:AlkA N-terminal domain-containing protein [Gemmatimonadaceae bacterium]
MIDDPAALHRAFAAHDARFDGVFYMGVTSTGIYCRPVCTARTPKAANCRFFSSAMAAEKARFRPCLRCRPELAPGNAPVDDGHRIATLLIRRIDEGMLDGGEGLERIAEKFGWSSRQIRRMVQREFGVSPMQLVQTRRLLLAKQLLTETGLAIGEVAFASGFASLRRFNDAFSAHYGMPPSRFRRSTSDAARGDSQADALTLQLGFRAPFDWQGLLRFLGARAIPGIERVTSDAYARTVRLGGHAGRVEVRRHPMRDTLLVALSPSLLPVLPALLGRLRQLFDLAARPDVIAAHLAADPLLAGAVRLTPGVRVPGAFDGFEMAVRAILGQQVTVKGASTLTGRLVRSLGVASGFAEAGFERLSPTPERVAMASVDEIGSLGVIASRARSLIALASEVAAGRLCLEPGADPDDTMRRLVALPGVGAWTAHYIAMRALRWPDAFPGSDLVLRQRLGGVSAAVAERRSQGWRPWRAYAAMYLWRGLPEGEGGRRLSQARQ